MSRGRHDGRRIMLKHARTRADLRQAEHGLAASLDMLQRVGAWEDTTAGPYLQPVILGMESALWELRAVMKRCEYPHLAKKYPFGEERIDLRAVR